MNEVEYAEGIVSRVQQELRSSQIILGTPPTVQLHSIGQSLGKSLTEQDVDEWLNCGEHRLLMKLISSGIIPGGRLDGPTRPHSHHEALRIASQRGYNVPESFYDVSKNYKTEDETWLALQMMLSGAGIWKRNANFCHRDVFANVAQVRAQFIVPDPFIGEKTPYIIDQLWIVNAGPGKIRLVGLEIDGPIHLSRSPEKSKARDMKLAALGYEIYHIAGWWCQIDPYRVICEFLSKSEIFPLATAGLIGSDLRTIDDYVCDCCGRPIVRWDCDWIQESRGGQQVVHRGCMKEE